MNAETIYHIVDEAAWAEARRIGFYAPADLGRWGFLHCCTEAQFAFVLEKHFAGRSGLLLLCLDPRRVSARLVWEKSEPDQDAFPHLYGPLPVSEVQGVRPIGE